MYFFYFSPDIWIYLPVTCQNKTQCWPFCRTNSVFRVPGGKKTSFINFLSLLHCFALSHLNACVCVLQTTWRLTWCRRQRKKMVCSTLILGNFSTGSGGAALKSTAGVGGSRTHGLKHRCDHHGRGTVNACSQSMHAHSQCMHTQCMHAINACTQSMHARNQCMHAINACTPSLPHSNFYLSSQD